MTQSFDDINKLETNLVEKKTKRAKYEDSVKEDEIINVKMI